jgi:HAD superfamily hydrolase (TIGR01509 family)
MIQMRLYIFDMGEVVAFNTDVFPAVCDDLGMTAEQFYGLAGSSLGKLMDGAITADEFWARFSSKYGKQVTEELFAKYFKPRLDHDVAAIVSRLKNCARVVCGTNTFDPHYDYLAPRGYYDLFDAVYASNKMGVSKPHPGFYQHILSAEGVRPENAVFIDDAEANVRAAERLGIRSILFRGSDRLKSEIALF